MTSSKMPNETVAASARPVTRRVTAQLEGDFVVFMIGMRVNQPWKVSAWLPVFLAMPKMIAELSKHPELGLLGGRFAGLTLIQFWRSSEHLNAYAQSREHVHLPAWQAFNQNARKSGGAVGIWHETYRVAAGQYETVYVDMPTFGLGQAGKLVEASGRRATAAGRMGGGPGGA
ncbi:hypothetical protein GCM10022631_21640 [Deinococcus rubellus]|uniref:DUF4188 domain-containing protein n=1 Tax=Deinococcus rubellus TaxID=1889240 RepID=A0ABY5YGY9_9DEIO|nr:DUF4188 domain-containing protein [Deinococcus rubellus]UWX64337.1 DUF4188 domain-containing protein [Deinococcus rubellus]